MIESAGGNWPALQLNDTPYPTANIDPGAKVGLELYSGSIYSSQNGGSFNNLGAWPGAFPFWLAIDFDGATGEASFYSSPDDSTYTLLGSIPGLSIVDLWPGETGDNPSNPQTIGAFVPSGGYVPRVAYVGVSSATDAGPVAEPAGAIEGDQLFMVCQNWFDATVAVPSCSGWTLLGIVNSTAEVVTAVLTKTRGATDEGPYTVSWTGAGVAGATTIVCLRGVNNADPAGPVSTVATTGEPVVVPGVTVDADGSLLLLAACSFNITCAAVSSTGTTWAKRANPIAEQSVWTAPHGAGATGDVTCSGDDSYADAYLMVVVKPA